jgi:anti-sigma factor RsiW
MTNCLMKSEEHADRLLAYCAGRLDVEAVNQMQRHMETCPACAALRNSQSVWSALDSWHAPAVSADFNRRLYARIEAADAMPWYRRWLDTIRVDAIRPLFAQPALPLAAAAVVVVTGFLLDHPAKVVPASAGQAAIERTVSATDAEQVEKTLDDLEMLRQFDVSSDQTSEDKEKTSKSM